VKKRAKSERRMRNPSDASREASEMAIPIERSFGQ
jgi:hypothetical protein